MSSNIPFIIQLIKLATSKDHIGAVGYAGRAFGCNITYFSLVSNSENIEMVLGAV